MNRSLCLLALGVFFASRAFAAYAPVPDIETGTPLVVELGAGAHWDNNIFSDPDNERDSFVYTASPSVRLNLSPSPQTFVSADYSLDASYFDDRPGEDTLYNHVLSGLFAHEFSERSSLEVRERLMLIDNPQSSINLGGTGLVPLQADQSYWSNSLSAVLNYGMSERLRLRPLVSTYSINFDNPQLSRLLDYIEKRAHIEVSYLQSRTMRLVGEMRYQDVNYDVNDWLKGSETLYFLGGFDYDIERVTSVYTRAGYESRDRNAGDDAGRFYGEARIRHNFLPNSYLSAGLQYSFEETQANTSYFDRSGPSFFGNLQFDPTGAGLVYITAYLSYSTWTLNARPGFGLEDIDENELRGGVSLAYTYDERWTFQLFYDIDYIVSDVHEREQERQRIGLSASYTFGLFQ